MESDCARVLLALPAFLRNSGVMEKARREREPTWGVYERRSLGG
jgi:hypothetical protein